MDALAHSAYLNGKTLPLAEVKVSALDRGFLFGDGVYEVARIYRGRPFLFDEHWARLGRSLDALRIGSLDLLRLKHDALALIAASGVQEGTIYVQVTRGAAPLRSHAFPKAPGPDRNPYEDTFPPETTPTTFMYVLPLAEAHAALRERGARAITYPDQRWGRCDIKSLNLLGNVFAAQAAKEAGAFEAILVDAKGIVTEGSHTSVFAVIGGALHTMPLGHEILPGITRAAVLRLASELGIPVEEAPLPVAGLKGADEVFLTGTTTEVLPIVRVDDADIGTGSPGPLTRALEAAYRALVARD